MGYQISHGNSGTVDALTWTRCPADFALLRYIDDIALLHIGDSLADFSEVMGLNPNQKVTDV